MKGSGKVVFLLQDHRQNEEDRFDGRVLGIRNIGQTTQAKEDNCR